MTLQENIDLTPWDFIKSCTLNELLEDEFVDGVFEIHFGDNSLFIKITNIEMLTHSESLLFCLNAATSRRSEKNPPFFSGDGLSDSLNISLISFCDPATHISGVDLGWYIGTHKWLTLQSDIQTCIERISQKLEKKVVMFGGSGGGFASIALSLKMNTDATIIAMNPQTNIIEYPTSRIYLHSAFPHNGNPPERFTLEDKVKWHTFLREKELIGTINKDDLNPLCKYIILQSWNDSHHFDRPMRTYSSGMKARLGISVATAFKPDLLLIDEVLGVGDASFRKKSEERVKDLIASSGSVVMVSHSMGLLAKICTRIIVLDDGNIKFQGEPIKAIEYYNESLS